MTTKVQSLKKQVTREAALRAIGVVIACVVMMVTGNFSESIATEKVQAQSQLAQAESQLGIMRNQITKTDNAEQRFSDLRVSRDNEEFVTTTETLKDILKKMKEQYRLSDAMRLTISQDNIAEHADFTGLNYKIIVREDMEIKVGTISDLHFFSFLQAMQRRMPGLIRITQMNVTRKSPMSIDVLSQMGTGAKPELVDASVKFTWFTLQKVNSSKAEQPKNTDSSAISPPNAGGV